MNHVCIISIFIKKIFIDDDDDDDDGRYGHEGYSCILLTLPNNLETE